MLYSHQGSEPASLPLRVRLEDGSTRTDSSTFTAEELTAWGYEGPYARPEYDESTQLLTWDPDSKSFLVLDKPEEPAPVAATTYPNYRLFQQLLYESAAYNTVKSVAQNSLLVNAAATEFAIVLEATANCSTSWSGMLDRTMKTLLSAVSLSNEETEELATILEVSDMLSHGYTSPLP